MTSPTHLKLLEDGFFCDANVISPDLPSNEEKRHPDALFSDSVIHSLLTVLLLCRLLCKNVILCSGGLITLLGEAGIHIRT